MIEQFTKEDFENYLSSNHSPFEPLGLIKGEYAYSLLLDNQVSITVRSSVKENGLSANVGKDSIRVWLVFGNKPLGSKISKWTTRQPGWQDRLNENIKQLTLWRTLAGDCKECDKPKGIFKAKTEANKGRPFARCREHDGFIWLDEPVKTDEIYFSEGSHGTGKETWTKSISHQSQRGEDTCPLRHTDATECNFTDEDAKSSTNLQGLSEKTPNTQQKQAIEADINADLRVLAGPGSGKTFVIERRYSYLVQNSINPESILVCTFNKTMADEMGHRIQDTCPIADLEQISTIHAFCYRLLCKWHPDSRYYKWQVPKDWQVKKMLEETIGQIWREQDKPSAKEVFDFISTSKYHSLSVDDSYLWFVDVLGKRHGEWLYEIRSRFDAWLNRNKFLTFADMLFLAEQRLKSDSQWRSMLQSKFSHVIIDEGQDTNYQAMRILITISLEPGENKVYESENL